MFVINMVYSSHLGGNFVGRNLGLCAPVPHVTLHVMLSAYGHYVFQVRGERLQQQRKSGQGYDED